MANAAKIRKCPDCGTNLGQKNVCPACTKPKNNQPAKTSDGKKVETDEKTTSAEIAGNVMAEVEKFVKYNRRNWNNRFDSFFVELEKKQKNLDYRQLYAACKRWDDIFKALQDITAKEKVISAEIMIKVMDTIPSQFAEISEVKTREIVREFRSEKFLDQRNFVIVTMPEDGIITKNEVKFTKNMKISIKDQVCVATGKDKNIFKILSPCNGILRLWPNPGHYKKGNPLCVIEPNDD